MVSYEVRAVRPTFPDSHGWFVTLDYDFPDGSGHCHDVIAEDLTQAEASDFVQKWTPSDFEKTLVEEQDGGLLTCTCGHSHVCPNLSGPYDQRLTMDQD